MALRTFTHLYDNYDDARHTVEALEAAGVPHSDISIVSNNADNRHAGIGSGTGTTAEQTGIGSGTGMTAGQTGYGSGTGTTAGQTGIGSGAGTAAGTEAEDTRAGTGASAGTLVGGGLGLLTGLGLLAIPGVGPVVAAGWLVATLTGAGIGAAGGGLLGSLVHAGVPEEHAHAYAEGVRRGGTLVTVRAEESQAGTIESVLNGRATSAVDINTRRSDYQAEGWTKYEETGPHYSPEQVEAERARRVKVVKTS